MQITAISDTHGKHEDLTDYLSVGGNVLVHAGDAANYKGPSLNQAEMIGFLDWFDDLPNWNYKIFVPGNHDTSIYAGLISLCDGEWDSIKMLINHSIVIDGYKFYGSPYTPSYGSGWAWNMKRHRIGHVWNGIPEDTDVLITHGPPQGHLDISVDREKDGYVQCGCSALRWKVDQLNIATHIFGHVHDRTGVYNHGLKTTGDGPMFVNASMTVHKYNKEIDGIVYETVHDPITLTVRKK